LFSYQLDSQDATVSELTLTSLLAEIDEEDNNAGHILGKTLAAYHKRQQFTPQTTDQIRSRIKALKDEFLLQPNVPYWMNKVAMKAGVDFFHAWRLWSAYDQRGVVSVESGADLDVVEWLGVFFEVLTLLPPKRVISYLAADGIKTKTVLTELRDCISSQKDLDIVLFRIPGHFSGKS